MIDDLADGQWRFRGQVERFAGQLGPLTADRYGTLRDGLEATTLQASAASGPLRLEVETTGAAALDLDVALVSYQSPQ